MQRRTEAIDIRGDKLHLPQGVVLRPPVSIEDLKKDTEHDPEGAEEFVALIRALRKQA